MPRLPRWLPLVTLLAVVAVPASARADSPFKDWNEFFAAFRSWSLDSTRIADVHSLMIERDAGTFVLEEGRLAFAKPFGGRQVAAVFVGRGSFRFAPAPQVERDQLERTFKSKVLRRKFESLTLIVADTTFAELAPSLTFRTDTLGALRKAWNTTFSYLTVRKLHYARPLPAVQMLLDGADNGLFWGLMNDRKNEDPIFFALVPDFAERVVLERKPDDDRQGLFRRYNSERVSQLFAAGDPDTLRRDGRPGYEVVHYRTDVTLATDLQCKAVADMDVAAYGAPRAWLGFDFPPGLTVDEVSMAGRPQKFFEEDENPMMWVRLDRAIPPDSVATLRVRYHGELFARADDWLLHKSSTGWYPKPWSGMNATWEMTFHTPREVQLVSSGERVAFRQEKLVNHSTWRIDYPLPWASFDVNFLRGTRVTGDSLAPVTVWMRHTDGAGRVEEVTFDELKDSKDYDHRVALDVARAFQFFRQQLGEPLAREFNAVETPSLQYEAFPGLVHYPGLVHMLPRENKTQPGAEFTPDLVRAHEVAHQWFGLSLFPATYHDVWLSEGFADFCSIWYLQTARQDEKNYFKVLESWRERLLTNRKYMFGEGQEAGPIWLGTRARSSTTPGDYDIIVYEKGAWVLHMLRNYLLDPGDPSEARFRDLMRDYYTEFRGRRVFTEEFRAVVEHATGEDMGWFFNQWVYGTGVPAFRFTWSAEPAGTQWRIKCRFERSKVPDSYRYPVLVRVDFPGGKFSRQRIWSEGPVTEFELPLAPEKPSSVLFNDLGSVLCEELK